MADKIFISYRRDDSKGEARSIYQRLERRFGDSQLFMDVDTIESGQNFRDALNTSLSDCRAMLVVIGRSWLTIQTADGKPRLHDDHDFVNLEVSSALKRGVAVIPVLVDGAKMPSVDQLPASLKGLAFMQGAIVTHENFSSDMDRLERRLGALVSSGRSRTRLLATLAVAAAVVGTAGWWWVSRHPGPTSASLACKNELGAKTPVGTSAPATITFTNESLSAIRIHWIDTTGQRVAYMTLPSGRSADQPSFAGHLWVATDLHNKCIELFTAYAPKTTMAVR